MLKNRLPGGTTGAPFHFRRAIAGLLVASISAFTMAPLIAQSDGKTTDYDWPTYANDPGSSKYAPLDQINAENVAQLQIAWVWDSVDNELTKKLRRARSLGFKSTPIKIGNWLYLSTSLGNVVSLDAKTGKQRWVFDTKTYEDGRPANLGFNHRGVAFWANGDQQRILMGTNNGYLWSIDAKTGQPDLSFGNRGKVDLTKGLGREVARAMYSIVAPPVIFENTVIVGSVVSDAPLAGWAPQKRIEMPPGHVRGFDIVSGKLKWMFHSIP